MAIIMANLALCRPLVTYIHGKINSILRSWKDPSSRASMVKMTRSENNIMENSVAESHEDTQRKEMREVV